MKVKDLSSASAVFPLEVWIDAVTTEHYHVIDRFGNRFMLSRVLRGKGAEPEVGEHWLVDRSLGRMSLAAIIHEPGSPSAPGGEDEVWIGATAPDPDMPYELWFDPDTALLYAWVDDAWVEVTSATITYVAGAGLTLTGGTFDLIAANGSLVVGADDVQVGYAGSGGNLGTAVTAARSNHIHDGVYTKKFSADVGGSTAVAVAHNLNTRDIVVNVYRNTTPWDTVDCDVERTDVNTVTLRFTTTPSAAEYRLVVTA